MDQKEPKMRTLLYIVIAVVVIGVIALATGFIDINQTQEAVLPDVTVEGGQLPAAEVETGEVSIGTATTEVEVPDIDVDVDVGTETQEVEVPTIDVTPAEETN